MARKGLRRRYTVCLASGPRPLSVVFFPSPVSRVPSPASRLPPPTHQSASRSTLQQWMPPAFPDSGLRTAPVTGLGR